LSQIREIWSKLAGTGQLSEGFVRLRISDIATCRAYAARNLHSSGEALMFEVATSSIPGKTNWPSGAGFALDVVPSLPGRNGQTRITLQAIDSTFTDVFHSLADDVVDHIAVVSTELDAVRTLLRRLAKWQAFLRAFGKQGLSLEQRRGLWGELRFLQMLAAEIGWESAVSAWKGFQKANHDFQCPTCAIEIKTTAAATPRAFGISNVRQLDDEEIGQLFVGLFRVEESDSGGKTLSEVVDAIRANLEPRARSQFDDGLFRVGYIEGHVKQYSSPRYIQKKIDWFKVATGFPRILGAEIPNGVEEVRYRVAIAACKDFGVEESLVLTQIKSGYGG
jgi:hypothetical protein